MLEGTPKNLGRALSTQGEPQEPGESPQYSRGGPRTCGEPSVLKGNPKNLGRVLSTRGEAPEPGESPQYSRGAPRTWGEPSRAWGNPRTCRASRAGLPGRLSQTLQSSCPSVFRNQSHKRPGRPVPGTPGRTPDPSSPSSPWLAQRVCLHRPLSIPPCAFQTVFQGTLGF